MTFVGYLTSQLLLEQATKKKKTKKKKKGANPTQSQVRLILFVNFLLKKKN
jgi:hypothetical protein